MPEIENLPENGLFGKFEIGKLLGCGAFAKVYHARNVHTAQSVAIKVISKSKICGTGLISNVKREISIMRRLHHPNIVKLYEVLATKTKIYFVLEFVKGGELFAKVAKGRFSENLGRKYFQQLISAVGYCHSRGVYHRDLKPENLLVDENGDLKVSDFGLSAVTGQIRPDGLLHTLCGTPAYVAPDILTKKGYDGARVDIWSCGVILFVLTAGYLPFNDPNLMALYKKIYKGEFRCPKWMSPEQKRFLNRILDTNQETRITIDEIVQDPWFNQGYEEIKFHGNEYESCKIDKTDVKISNMNAFDIISFSSGLDLSGLFDDSFNSARNCERFIGTESEPEKIIEKVEEIAEIENLKVMAKKELGVDLVGLNVVFSVDVYRLTDELVVVEARRFGGDAQCYNDIWHNTLRPALSEIIGRPGSAGN